MTSDEKNKHADAELYKKFVQKSKDLRYASKGITVGTKNDSPKNKRKFYIDKLANWGAKWGKSCHLITDCGIEAVSDLCSFAESIGMEKEWLHDGGHCPHFDLNEKFRIKAIKKGAVEIRPEKFLQLMKCWRRFNKENNRGSK